MGDGVDATKMDINSSGDGAAASYSKYGSNTFLSKPVPRPRVWSIDEMAVLGSSLVQFKGFNEKTQLLTLLIPHQNDLKKIRKLINKQIQQYLVDSTSMDPFQFEALDWFSRQFDPHKLVVPENGLALFAGIISNGPKSNEVTTRVILSIQPEDQISSVTYAWGPSFYPELLLANLTMDRVFGMVLISKSKIAFGCYMEIISKDSQDLPLKEYLYPAGTEFEALLRIVSVYLENFFADSNKPPVTGLIIAAADDLSPEQIKEIHNTDKLYTKATVSLPRSIVEVNAVGSDGLNQAIEKTSLFRESTWFEFQKTVIWKVCPVHFMENSSSLENCLRDNGLGRMEIVSSANLLVYKTVILNFEYLKKIQDFKSSRTAFTTVSEQTYTSV